MTIDSQEETGIFIIKALAEVLLGLKIVYGLPVSIY